MSKFDKLVDKLEAKGDSADSAKKIAATIGREKYGAEGMAKKAAAGRAKLSQADQEALGDEYARMAGCRKKK